MKKVLFSVAAGALSLSLSAQEQRVPLFEMSTASTCPPCKPGNEYFEGQMKNVPESQYVKIKYQWFFPGAGDPYCTDESLTRVAYYGINGVPHLNMDGLVYDDHPQGGFNLATFNTQRGVPATYKLSGTYTVDSVAKVVKATVKYKPLEAGTAPKLYVALIETITKKNAKTNGETEFYNVMKKMMPTDQGTDISSTALNVEGTTNLTFNIAGNYRLPTGSSPANASQRINNAIEHSIEIFGNLRVVAWVQGSDKKVYQAANLSKPGSGVGLDQVSSTISGVTIYPNPAKSDIKIKFEMSNFDIVTASIYSLTGKLVKTQQVKLNPGQTQISFNTNDLANGAYNVIIFDSNNNSFAQQVSITK